MNFFQSLPSGGRKRKKAEVALFRTASALLYFQSLNISSRALSIAAFRLFSMILNSSASNTEDCFFFFRFFSSAVISLPSPHLKYWGQEARQLLPVPCSSPSWTNRVHLPDATRQGFRQSVHPPESSEAAACVPTSFSKHLIENNSWICLLAVF